MSDLRYRNFVSGLVVSLLLVGCQPNATTPSVTGPTRTISHASGESQVPIDPQRVVVLDTAPLDATLALGIKPVGTVVYGILPEYLGEQVANIEIIGDGNQPNLEAILNLEPDLILGTKIGNRNIYRQLSRIAPTVLTEGSGRAGDWQENLQLYAEALGKSEVAEQLLQDYRDNAQRLRLSLETPQNLEVSVLVPLREKVWSFTIKSFSGSILNDVGLARNPAQSGTKDFYLQLSPEALDALDGDHIILMDSTRRPGEVQKAEFMTHPIWSQLKAVKQDNVCKVSGAVWAAGRSILAAKQVLVDIEECLALETLE